MDRWDQFNSLFLIRPVVNPCCQTVLLECCIDFIRPLLSPFFQKFRGIPAGSGNSRKDIFSIFIPDTVSIFIQLVLPPLFLPPCSIRIHGTDRNQHMEVGIVCNLRVTGFPLMDCHIHDHSPADKLFPAELPCQFHIFFHRQLIL